MGVYVACAMACPILGGTEAAASPPVAKRLTGTLIGPSSAWAYYGTGTTHTNGVAAWSSTPPEIQALARTLGSGRLAGAEYAKNVYNYVRNNVDTEFRFGLAKGGRGALIDQSGTPFDQAELVVKLLRAGGVSATYQVGTITLDPSQFGLWTGLVTGLNESTQTFTVNAKAACQLLADGGIPATVNGASSCAGLAGNLSTVTLAHIWVSAAGKLYDPSYKQYELRNGIDIPAAMGCGTAAASTCGQNLINAVMNGSTTGSIGGVSTIETPNAPAISTQLNSQTGAFESKILTDYPLARTTDVVGGKDLLQSDGDGSATLGYVVATQYTWNGDIPDQFRTSLNVSLAGCVTNGLYGDEMAGRRFTYVGPGGTTLSAGTLYMDGQTVACAGTAFGSGDANFAVNLPYAASSGQYGDDTINLSAIEPSRIKIVPNPASPEGSQAGSYPITLAVGFGDSKQSGDEFANDLQTVSPVTLGLNCRPSTTQAIGLKSCENDMQPAKAKSIQIHRMSSRWSPLKSPTRSIR
jgi:hypothetical protein